MKNVAAGVGAPSDGRDTTIAEGRRIRERERKGGRQKEH